LQSNSAQLTPNSGQSVSNMDPGRGFGEPCCSYLQVEVWRLRQQGHNPEDHDMNRRENMKYRIEISEFHAYEEM